MNIFSPDRLHVVASDSGAGGLKQAAYDLGQRVHREGARRNIVVFNPTLFTVGPISGIAAPGEHVRWLEANARGAWRFTGLSGHEAGYIRRVESNWSHVRSWGGPITLWYSSRNVAERSFYLTYVNVHNDIPDTDIVDAARLPMQRHPPIGIGELTPERMVQAAALSFRPDADQVEIDRRAFQALSDSPAGVRILEGGDLVEAPIHAHDAKIIRRLDHTWKKLSRVMGDVYGEELERGTREIEYGFLLWRLEVLCKEGRIERRGESEKPLYEDNPSRGEVRRA
jgi:hypothetical protein